MSNQTANPFESMANASTASSTERPFRTAAPSVAKVYENVDVIRTVKLEFSSIFWPVLLAQLVFALVAAVLYGITLL